MSDIQHPANVPNTNELSQYNIAPTQGFTSPQDPYNRGRMEGSNPPQE